MSLKMGIYRRKAEKIEANEVASRMRDLKMVKISYMIFFTEEHKSCSGTQRSQGECSGLLPAASNQKGSRFGKILRGTALQKC